jgi:8-oxo-dGTP pyrophosphatase MutT (NUDIX family)
MNTHQGTRHVGPYTILHSKPIYENPWLKVREDRVTRTGGQETTFGVVTMKPGVTVLPIDDSDQVYLVREFKYGVAEPSLEAMSGAIESGETPERTGLRELGEEIGLVAASWVDMGVVNPFTTVVSSPNHMFLARDLSETRRSPDAGEQIETVKMPFSEALEAVLKGTITHAASCVLILKTHLYLTRAAGG